MSFRQKRFLQYFLLRATQTAEIIAYASGQTVKIAPELVEYHVGIYEDTNTELGWQSYATVQEEWFKKKNWDARMEGGESFNDIRARFIPFIQKLVADYGREDGVCVLVAHGGVYKCMLPLVFDNIDFKFVQEYAIANATFIKGELREGKLHCLEWSGISLND